MSNNAPLAVVDTSSCKHFPNPEMPFILVLKKGEDLFESLLQAANAMNLKSASISGLGALDDVTLAFYHLNLKAYQTQLFSGSYELVSLSGNITFFEGARFLHLHGALGKEDYNLVGGHMMSAIVGPTAEITIIPLPEKITREHDEHIGLKLMCPITQSAR